MRIIKANFEILTKIDGNEILKKLEAAGRTCYKSEDKITKNSAASFVKKLIERGHEAMIEHESITVRIICDRGVTHEIVRHRIASYAQESTRYCNYVDDSIQFIQPCWFENDHTKHAFDLSMDSLPESEFDWLYAMKKSETVYKRLIKAGWGPQQARSVLPNSLKTEIVVTMNLREWRHFFKLRTAKVAHPQMQEIACPMLEKFKDLIPVVFDDVGGNDR